MSVGNRQTEFWGIVLALMCCGLLFAEESNLLANPSLEVLQGELPKRWDLFVQPQEGAFGKLSDTASEGLYAVMLHTPAPYPEDPFNNWSQNITGEFGGATLRVAGDIKVEGATEAAVWLQCWRTRPWRVLKAGSSSTDAPLWGTRDWERVTFNLDVPEGTRFITLRCVLRGVGTAWFDNLSVVRVDTTPKAAIANPEEAPVQSEAAPIPSSLPAAMDSGLQLQEELMRLQQANLILAEALQEMRKNNGALAEDLRQLQVQLLALQRQQEHPLGPVPPLVPHVSEQ